MSTANLSQIKSLTINGISLKQLFINGLSIWSKFKNWVRYSTETDGTTIYNGGLGYKNGYRVRSDGAEATQSGAACTGYIPVTAGDVIRVSGCTWDSSVSSAINAFDSSFTNLGQVVGNGGDYGYSHFGQGNSWAAHGQHSIVQTDSYYEWIVPPYVSSSIHCAYIRITGKVSDGSKLCVTINE